MRSTFLTTAILLCLGTAAVAADRKRMRKNNRSKPSRHSNAQQLAGRRSPLGIAPHQEVRRES